MAMRSSRAVLRVDDVAIGSTSTTPIFARPDLLPLDDLPQWLVQLHGPSIRLGYRPAQRPLYYYFGSLFEWHNEFINAWSHLFGAMIFVLQICIQPLDAYMLCYRLGAVGCFFTSVSYHIFYPLNAGVYARLQRADYAGIFVLIGVSAIPYYSVEFYCQPRLEAAAVATTAVAMLVLAALVATQEWFGKSTPRGKLMRVVAFSSFAMTCVVFGALALFGGFSPLPYFRADPMLAVALWTATALYVLGPVVYASAFPERFRPGRFDFIGTSHQTMHVAVLAAALLNDWCMERMRALRVEVRLCNSDV